MQKTGTGYDYTLALGVMPREMLFSSVPGFTADVDENSEEGSATGEPEMIPAWRMALESLMAASFAEEDVEAEELLVLLEVVVDVGHILQEVRLARLAGILQDVHLPVGGEVVGPAARGARVPQRGAPHAAPHRRAQRAAHGAA